MTRHDTATSLEFEHFGDLLLSDELLVADAAFLQPTMASMLLSHRGQPQPARCSLPVRAGRWHVLIAGGDSGAELLLLTHESELDGAEHAAPPVFIGRAMVPSARLVAGLPALADDPALVTALGDVAASELPGMVRDLGVMVSTADIPIVQITSTTAAPHATVLVSLTGA